jgi:uncharacterized protein with HEPN domain
MQPDEHDAALLYDMLMSGETVVRYVSARTREDFEQDGLLRDAVERRIEVIGEAARGVSRDLREAHPLIPWGKITTTRHILAHAYGDVDPDILWRIATVHVPELIRLFEPLIPPIPGDPESEN